MLHTISSAGHEVPLNNICDFQREVLEWVCNVATTWPPTKATVKAKFGNERGDWLSAKLWKPDNSERPILLAMGLLHTYVTANQNRINLILTAYDNDQKYAANVQTPFYFQYFTALSQVERQLTRPVTQCFYDFLSKGGIPIKVGNNWKKYTRDQLIQSFWDKNPKFQVCPACDGPKPDAVNLKVYADADHYLPKSAFPFLAVHPANLVPQCVSCNRSFKLARSPLKPYGLGERGDVFLPYHIPSFGPLKLALSRRGKVVSPSLADSEQTTSRRLKSVQIAFRLQKRWQSRIERVAADTAAELADYGSLLANLGSPASPRDWLRSAVNTRSKRFKSSFGQTDNAILRLGYIDFLANTAIEFDRFATAIGM